MKRYDQAFEKIKAGTQSLELRANGDKPRSVVKGDRIGFLHRQNGQELMTRVLDRFDYPDFFSLYQVICMPFIPPLTSGEKGC